MYTWRNFRTTPHVRELEDSRDFTGYAIQSQYSASTRILALAAGYQKRIDPHTDVDLLYTSMIDIYTATGVGLDNWGVILQIGRVIPGPYMEESFGFDRSMLHPFNQLPFVPDNAGGEPGAFITLDDEMFRLLLLYKALANISASDAATQNKLLSVLVDTGIGGFSGAAYVLEIGPMVIRWVFEDTLSPQQLAVFKAAGTLARGAGVGWELYTLNSSRTFGFDVTSGRSSVATMLPEVNSGNTPSSLNGSLTLASATLDGFQPFSQAAFASDKALVSNRS